MSDYAHYRGRNIGRLLHFLQSYCPPLYSNLVFNGKRQVHLGSQLFATYEWEDPDTPRFVFTKEIYNQRQEDMRASILHYEDLKERLSFAAAATSVQS